MFFLIIRFCKCLLFEETDDEPRYIFFRLPITIFMK